MSEVKEKTTFQVLLGAAQAYAPEDQPRFKPQGKKELDSEFLSRLVTQISALPIEQYDDLPEDTAQAWFTTAAEAFNNSEPIPPPDGFVSAYVTPGPKPEKKAASPAAAPPAPKGRVRSEVTVGRVIRRALIEDQSLEVVAIRDRLATAGFRDTKASTISSYMSDTLETLRVAAEMGRFSPSSSKAASA